jgi:hypothetical protein
MFLKKNQLFESLKELKKGGNSLKKKQKKLKDKF